jgi:hypothetical protein
MRSLPLRATDPDANDPWKEYSEELSRIIKNKKDQNAIESTESDHIWNERMKVLDLRIQMIKLTQDKEKLTTELARIQKTMRSINETELDHTIHAMWSNLYPFGHHDEDAHRKDQGLKIRKLLDEYKQGTFPLKIAHCRSQE